PLGVFKSTDNGTTWSAGELHAYGPDGPSIAQITIDPLNPSIVYGSNGGVLLKSLDAGATWNQVGGATPYLNTSLLTIDPNIEGTLYLTGGSYPIQGVFKSIDGGITWQFAGQGIPNSTNILALAMDPHTTNTVYAAGYRSFQTNSASCVFKTTN